MNRALRRTLKDCLAQTRLARYIFYRQSTTFRPSQLAFLLDCVERTVCLGGTFVEIGCFEGATTIWLNRHLEDLGTKRRYVAIDTFQGFLQSDVKHEVGSRGHALHSATYTCAFEDNKREWVARTLQLNGVQGVELIEIDANVFDYAGLGPVAFALVDVDLYRPVTAALGPLWRQLLPGGMIIVDDCDEAVPEWDGALHAYKNFCALHGLPEQVVHRKLGVLTKPALQ